MGHEHFQPTVHLDPQEERRVRSHLDQVDTAAFTANRQVLARTVGRVDAGTFQKLATAAAYARASWVSAALTMTEKSGPLAAADVARLASLRGAYQELSEAYEATRRMVERGYLCYLDKGPPAPGR